MRRAVLLAATPTVRPGTNPRVGCVLLDTAGRVLAEGVHRGAGTAHAEVEALENLHRSGVCEPAHTAVVTLEPCIHTGRTPPCTDALLAAGIRRVVIGAPDPNPVAAGGAQRLRSAGVQVQSGVLADVCERVDEAWFHSVRTGRPHVTWKLAASVDGRVAAADGTSRWISGPASRRHGHELRRAADCVLVGTGTALADDCRLTVRVDDAPLPPDQQPVRAVMGLRPLPAAAALLDGSAPTVELPTHDPAEALSALWDKGVRRVLVEGGPTVAGVFAAAGLIDRVVAYVAPVLLGAGPPALGPAGVHTLADAHRLQVREVHSLGPDVMIDLVPGTDR
ncbi:MAG: riboflavin biosynthesis protein RibD [Micrococcales bacterium]|nr:MAG: riboflavin biosynthesis protein RibD [Micrococcales bacterium]